MFSTVRKIDKNAVEQTVLISQEIYQIMREERFIYQDQLEKKKRFKYDSLMRNLLPFGSDYFALVITKFARFKIY